MVKIFVGHLADTVDKNKLEELFGKFGEVIDSEVLKNFGFVHMADKKEAEDAISELHRSQFEGQTINVELSKTKVANAAKIFVGNLVLGTKSSELHKLFMKYGSVIECDVITNFGFVHMSREAKAQEAIKELNDYELNGNKLRVQMSRTQGPRGGGGGRGGGSGRFEGHGGRRGGGRRFNPYGDFGGDMYDMPRSRNYPPVDRMGYDSGMRRDDAFGGRRGGRGGPSYMRLLRERALLARRLISEREAAAGYRDAYSGGMGFGNVASSRLSRDLDAAGAAYTDFADDFADLPLDDGFGLDAGALDRYGGPSAYGSYY